MKRTIYLLLFLSPLLLFASESDDFSVAVRQMNDGFYSQSISTFQKLYQTSKTPEIREKSLLLLGESYLRSDNINKSLRIFKNYLSNYPEGKFVAFDYSRLGIIYMKKGSYKRAIYYLEKAYRFKQVRYKNTIAVNLAECYEKIGNATKGISIIENRLKTTTENSDLLYIELAELYESQGDYKKAISSVKNVINDTKSNYTGRANYLSGEIYFKYGNYNKAINYLNRNIRSNNDYKFASMYLLGEIYTLTGNYYTATNLFNKLSKNARYKEVGLLGKAWLEYQRGNYSKSLTDLSNISNKSKLIDRKIFYEAICYKELKDDSLFLDLSDSLRSITNDKNLISRIEYEKFDYYLKKNYNREVKTQLELLSKVDPAYYKLALANYKYKHGKYSDALIIYTTLLKSKYIREYSTSIKYHIILSNFKLKRYQSALTYIGKWWGSLSYYNNELILLKDDILLKKKQYKKSIALLTKYYPGAKEPYKELSLRALAWTYIKMKDYKNGYIYFKKFTENYPTSKYYDEALLELGNCSYNIGKKDEALSYYSKIKGKKEIQKALFRRGKVLYERGDYSAAIHVLESFSNRYPANSVADDALYYIALAFYNTNNSDSAKYYTGEILDRYKNSDKYYNAILLLGDISYNNKEYTKMLNYYANVIKNDIDTIHIKHAFNTIVDYFNSTGNPDDIVPYFNDNFVQTLRNHQIYNVFIADYLIEKGLYKEVSYFIDNLSSKKYKSNKSFLEGKLYIAEGDTLKGINLIKSINRNYAKYEIITYYYTKYNYDSLLYYVKTFENQFGTSDKIKFLKAYALFWINGHISDINIHTSPYNSRIAVMKLIQSYEKNKNINILSDALKLASSNDPFTKAYAMYLAGKIKYDSGNYNDALTYLLKIKYIYNKADIVKKALSISYESLKDTNSKEKNRILEEIKKYEKLLEN